ncbi:MAG: chorismate mutase [Methylocystis sp.]|nr:chorismate mutase [Methylocystis sp.]MBI3275093.1 chorismate mutase [Methylocystis sp.]
MRDHALLNLETEALSGLRAEIDRIDLEMHRLLMQRGEIIDRLIAVKRNQGGGSAFRPDREAQMMRALVERHRGLLPLDTVESIWRIIVSTFTYVQSNYSVHADDSGGDVAMRDCARFHFGFTVPYVTHHGAAAVINAVAASQGDLGVMRSAGALNDGAWWMRLIGAEAPKIIARLPFVERPDHPAGLPVFVVAKPLADAASQDIALHAISLPRWLHSIPAAIGGLEGEILGSAPDSGGLSLLVAAPGRVRAEDFERELQQAGADRPCVGGIGSHAVRFELDKARSGVFAPRS